MRKQAATEDVRSRILLTPSRGAAARSPPRCPLFQMRCPTPRTATHCTSPGSVLFLFLLSVLHTHRWRTLKARRGWKFQAPSCRDSRGRLTARGTVTLKATAGYGGPLRAVCSIENRTLTLSIASPAKRLRAKAPKP